MVELCINDVYFGEISEPNYLIVRIKYTFNVNNLELHNALIWCHLSGHM